MYVFSIPAKILVGEAEIYRRTKERRKGYQRDLTKVRLGKSKTGVAGYLLNQMGIFPTSILVNVRKEDKVLRFDEEKIITDKISVGSLHIPDDIIWYVIDGQHRLEGLKEAIREKSELQEYPVLITMTNEDLFYEMLIFYMVNSRAKSVKTDLAYRILQRMHYDDNSPKWIQEVIMTGADRRKAIASTIVDYLNWKEESPFYNKIQEIGESHKDKHLTTDGTFTRYVTYILSNDIFQNMYDEDVANLLISYWNTIKAIWPVTFETPDDYVLLTSLGFSSLSRLFPTIYGYCARDQNVTDENMKKYLEYLLIEAPEHRDADYKRPIDSTWWHKVDGPGLIRGGGEGLFKNIAQNFAEKINIAIKKERSKIK